MYTVDDKKRSNACARDDVHPEFETHFETSVFLFKLCI